MTYSHENQRAWLKKHIEAMQVFVARDERIMAGPEASFAVEIQLLSSKQHLAELQQDLSRIEALLKADIQGAGLLNNHELKS